MIWDKKEKMKKNNKEIIKGEEDFLLIIREKEGEIQQLGLINDRNRFTEFLPTLKEKLFQKIDLENNLNSEEKEIIIADLISKFCKFYEFKQVKLATMVPKYENAFFIDTTESFRSWFKYIFEKRKHCSLLQQKLKIYNILIENKSKIIQAEKDYTEAKNNFLSHPLYKELLGLQTEIHKKEAAIKSMIEKINNPKTVKIEETKIHLQIFEKKLEELKPLLTENKKNFVEYQIKKEKKKIFKLIKRELGLEQEKDELTKIRAEVGTFNNSAGSSFEDLSFTYLHNILLPQLLSPSQYKKFLEDQFSIKNDNNDKNNNNNNNNDNDKSIEKDADKEKKEEEAGEEIKIIQNVTMGLAVGEIDFMVVKCKKVKDNSSFPYVTKIEKVILEKKKLIKQRYEVIQVLYLIECKSNPNDIIHSIPILQTVLSFVTNQSKFLPSNNKNNINNDNNYDNINNDKGYHFDPLKSKTAKFPKGIFLNAALHYDTRLSSSFIFPSPSVFELFKRNEHGFYSERFMFITKGGSLGIPSSVQLKVIARAYSANDYKEFDVECDEDINNLREWTIRTFPDADPFVIDNIENFNNDVILILPRKFIQEEGEDVVNILEKLIVDDEEENNNNIISSDNLQHL